MPKWGFLPVSAVYGTVTSVRNRLFDWGILPSKKYPIPLIGIGNLSTGGTGKSPHTIYILNLIKDSYESAMISRGYGRKTKGLVVANYESTYEEIGDEPLQIFERFRNKVLVIVAEKRRKALEYALQNYDTQVAVLDDCFQHRYVTPGLSILLTAYGDLYKDDYLLPVGNLRESRKNADRANLVIVSKCPDDLSEESKTNIKNQLSLLPEQKLFFSSIEYGNKIMSRSDEIHLEELVSYEVVLVTGIANDAPLVEFLRSKVKALHTISYPDHHRYSEKEVHQINNQLQSIKGEKLLLTTEKDFMRLRDFKQIFDYLYYLPIETYMHEKDIFNTEILSYVQETL